MGIKIFVFRRWFDSVEVHFEQKLCIPITSSVEECFIYIAELHNVPLFAHQALWLDLEQFIREEKERRFKASYQQLLDAFTSKSVGLDVNTICTAFEKAYQRDNVACYNYKQVSDDEHFGRAYLSVVHSPAAQELICLEQSFALAVSEQIDQRDNALDRLEQDVMARTEHLQRHMDTPETVTQLQVDHSQERELLMGRWNSCISELKHDQRKALRDLVVAVSGDLFGQCKGNQREVWHLAAEALVPSSIMRPLRPTVSSSSNNADRYGRQSSSLLNASATAQSTDPWSQSFSVQLGRQMRTFCTLRLIRADPLELLIDRQEDLSNPESLAQRMGNALGIYSNELNGLVLLVDKSTNASQGIKRRLAEICERSAEFHFPELGCQQEEIQQTINRIYQHPSSAGPDEIGRSPIVPRHAEPSHGDVYITRHSNLASCGIGGLAGGGGGIGVIFHLMLDPSPPMTAPSGDGENRLGSTSALHCALTAIIRLCCDYDITTLSMPLLLVPSLRDYMDRAWRRRRAEAIFKALKGVLMELATWYGPCLHSLLLFVPPEVVADREEFLSLGTLISTSFLRPNAFILPSANSG